MLLLSMLALGAISPAIASSTEGKRNVEHWIGTWAASVQPALPANPQSFHNQSLRLIVHTSAGGSRVRIRISNTYGDHPLLIGTAHAARRSAEADIDPASDRALMFQGQPSATIAAGSMAVSDPVELEVPALSDLAISLFLPETTVAATSHILAKQTSYVSLDTGDSTADAKFTVGKKIRSWPFLTGVDIAASPRGAAIVAFGSSLTDGDGSATDTNGRWPDVLAARLQNDAGRKELGVLNEGIIGNRLLADSPARLLTDGPQTASRFGAALGEAGLKRFKRDVLDQTGVKYVFMGLGINDLAYPGSLTAEKVSAKSLIAGYRRLIASAHQKGVRIIGLTNPPFESSFLDSTIHFYSPEKEAVRQEVNAWIRGSGKFDDVVDFDRVLRDPSHPTQLLPAYDSGDHIHPNNAGYIAAATAIPLVLFEGH